MYYIYPTSSNCSPQPGPDEQEPLLTELIECLATREPSPSNTGGTPEGLNLGQKVVDLLAEGLG